jgi:hypothetical protein
MAPGAAIVPNGTFSVPEPVSESSVLESWVYCPAALKGSGS